MLATQAFRVGAGRQGLVNNRLQINQSFSKHLILICFTNSYESVDEYIQEGPQREE